MNFILFHEIINVLYVLIVLFAIYRVFKIPLLLMFLLLLHLPCIYLFNGILFEPSYMPDQFQYLDSANKIRFFNFEEVSVALNVFLASCFFAYFPIPFIDSLYSIALINYLLYVVLFLILYKKNILNNIYALSFYFFYPSLLLYSSVALRDMLVAFIFVLILLSFIEKKYFHVVILVIFMKYLKMQIFFIFILAYCLTYFKKMMHYISQINAKFYEAILLILLIPNNLGFIHDKAELLGNIRIDMYGINNAYNYEQYTRLSLDNFITELFIGFFRILFSPNFYELTNMYQVMQMIENIIILVILIHVFYLLIKNKLYSKFKFFIVLLTVFISIHGLVLFNAGTIARYKFPMMLAFIIFAYYFIYKEKKCVE